MTIPILTACETAGPTADGAFNIIGAYWIVRAKSIPVSRSMTIAIRAFFDEHEGGGKKNFEVSILNQDGKSIVSFTFEDDVQFRERIGYLDIPLPCEVKFPAFGEYTIVAIVDTKFQARTPLVVERE
jgi:hypothetical protein